VPGGTVVRVETDADRSAKYEAHMTDASGNPVTVYVDANYDCVSAESGRPRGGEGRLAPPLVPNRSACRYFLSQSFTFA
jgi:hypothetical protein